MDLLINVSINLIYDIINDIHYPNLKLLKKHKTTRKDLKKIAAKEKILENSLIRKKITKTKKEKKSLIEENTLLEKGRPIKKICHACYCEKNTVRDFPKSTNHWDGRGPRCLVCIKNHITIPDILNMNLPNDHPLMEFNRQLEKDYTVQKKIIELEDKGRQVQHIKKLTENFTKKNIL